MRMRMRILHGTNGKSLDLEVRRNGVDDYYVDFVFFYQSSISFLDDIFCYNLGRSFYRLMRRFCYLIRRLNTCLKGSK